MLQPATIQFLINHFKRSININDEEAGIISEAFSELILKKKKDVLIPGDICRRIYLVKQGCLRSYQIDQKGVEQIYQIAIEHNWISDLFSFISQKPSEMYIETIETADIIYIDVQDLEQLYLKVPKLERFFRILFQNAYVATLQRLNSSKNESAETRYNNLIKNQPQLIQRVPLIHIASYLGITPESLSRIRKQHN